MKLRCKIGSDHTSSRSSLIQSHIIFCLCTQRLRTEEQMANVAPKWVSDKSTKACQFCNDKFSLFKWKHHCRSWCVSMTLRAIIGGVWLLWSVGFEIEMSNSWYAHGSLANVLPRARASEPVEKVQCFENHANLVRFGSLLTKKRRHSGASGNLMAFSPFCLLSVARRILWGGTF